MTESDRLFDFIGEAIEGGARPEALDAELDQRFGETRAVMVLDSTGFTRATKALGPGYFLSIILRMRRACRAEAKRFNAVGMRCHADNFYAEFKTVDDALAAAFAMHRHFEENPVPLLNKDDKFGVCVGIGYGRVLRSDHDGVYGNEMNYASKLGEDIAERGETLLTEAAFAKLSDQGSVQAEKGTFTASGVKLPVYSVHPATD